MKNIYRKVFALLCCFAANSAYSASQECYYVYLTEGGVDAFPSVYVKQLQKGESQLQITLVSDSVLTYDLSQVDSVSPIAPQYPVFTSFKFNNKYNEQLMGDVYGTIGEERISAEVGAIGKNLTASFQTDLPDAEVWVGNTRQESKVTRNRFDKEVTYTVSLPHYRTFSMTKVREEIWSVPEEVRNEIALTADQLSTNAPSNYDEGLDKLIDGEVTTFFHSTWGSGTYTKLPETTPPYVSVALTKPISALVLYYLSRTDADNRYPEKLTLYASNDNVEWTQKAVLENLPTGRAAEYTSEVLPLGAAYRYLKVECTKSAYKNYLCLAEMKLYDVILPTSKDSVLLQPAQYAYGMYPLGHNYTVGLDWLTDHATAVPRIDINIEGGEMVSSKDYYLNAYMTIQGNGVFANFQDSVQIKGRGNSSWSSYPYAKNPYRLKFAVAKKPFGLTKGKNWVLLANAQGGSMMANAMAMKAGRMIGAAYTNQIIPVDLYINDSYRGSYMFTQHVGLSNNSVAVPEENAVMLELDSYYDEAYKFRTTRYSLPVNIKDPDLSLETTNDRLNLIKQDFNRLTNTLYAGGDYEKYIDVDAFARFLMVNDLVQNMEICHPKSTFLFKEDLYALGSKYVFGPLWDFDWGFGYEATRTYYQTGATQSLYSKITNAGYQFFSALQKSSDVVKRNYYKVWVEFMAKYYQELLDYADDYFAYANSSFENNATVWGDGADYAPSVTNMKNWFNSRVTYIMNNIDKYNLNIEPKIEVADVNGDGVLTVADVVCAVDHVLGLEPEDFVFTQADVNGDGVVTISDIVWVIAYVMESGNSGVRNYRLPDSGSYLAADNFAIALGEETSVALRLNEREKGCSALQFDLELPEGLSLQDIQPGSSLSASHQLKYEPLADGKVRVLVYSDKSADMAPEGTVMELKVRADEVVRTNERALSFSNGTVVDKGGEEQALHGTTALFALQTGLQPVAQTFKVEGGTCLTITAMEPQTVSLYGADGRLVRLFEVQSGTQSFDLPKGIYLVQDKKIIIY